MPKASLALKIYLTISLILTILAVGFYPGSNVAFYLVFSFLSFFLIYIAFRKSNLYFVYYSCVLLWLGFWWKSTAFFLKLNTLVESTGGFDFSPVSIDQTMIVSSVGLSAVILGLKCSEYLQQFFYKIKKPNSGHPFLIKINFNFLWIAFYLLVLTTSLLNFYYGFQQAGLTPRTILPFPLNAGIFFMLSTGFGVLVALIIDYQLKYDKKVNVIHLLVSMSITTLLCISTLSRANIIFYPIAIMAVYFFKRKQYPAITLTRKLIALFFIFFIYVASFSSISLLRDFYYIPASNVPANPIEIMRGNGVVIEGNKVLIAFKRLLLSRWIGYEGVMTAVGHSDKSSQLLFDLVTQIPEIGKPDEYLLISKSGLDLTMNQKFYPTTLPGPVGFVYLSGSLLTVFIVIFLLIVFYALGEILLNNIFNNYFLNSFYGMVSALMFTQMGLAPINILKFYVIWALMLTFLYILKNVIKSFKVKEMPYVN